MTAPTNNLNVAPGAIVTCAVTSATDSDHWRTAWSPNGDEADHINYNWTASGGSFSTPGYPSTSWTAPATPGTYTLTCTIYDDAIIPQGDLQGGTSNPVSTRTDSPVVRTVTVIVSPKKWDKGAAISGGAMKALQDQRTSPFCAHNADRLYRRKLALRSFGRNRQRPLGASDSKRHGKRHRDLCLVE